MNAAAMRAEHAIFKKPFARDPAYRRVDERRAALIHNSGSRTKPVYTWRERGEQHVQAQRFFWQKRLDQALRLFGRALDLIRKPLCAAAEAQAATRGFREYDATQGTRQGFRP